MCIHNFTSVGLMANAEFRHFGIETFHNFRYSDSTTVLNYFPLTIAKEQDNVVQRVTAANMKERDTRLALSPTHDIEIATAKGPMIEQPINRKLCCSS